MADAESTESSRACKKPRSEPVANAPTTKFTIAADGTIVSEAIPPPPAGLYTSEGTPPSECEAAGFDGITESHIKAYVEHGYIVVRNAFGADDVAAALGAIDKITSEADPEFAAAVKAFEKRDFTTITTMANDGRDGPGIQFEASGADLPKGRRQDHVRKLKNFHDCNEVLGGISWNPTMLLNVSRLIHGWDGATASGIEVFQSIALLKPPKVGREKPWHQDNAYFNIAPKVSGSGAPTSIVGIWIALDEAKPDNGCMYVLPKKHTNPVPHWQRRDWQICDDQIPLTTLAVPMKPGDLLFFSSLLPHGTPPNYSDRRRRAVQFHMVPAELARCPMDDRLAAFGAEGKNVSC